jgi:hypothetical protein
MKLYKDNPEIQKLGYNILSQFAKNKVYAASLINNGILPAIHQTLENALFSDMMKESKPIKAEVYKLLANISQDQGNAPRIADELMGQLISEIKDNEPDNVKEIVMLLNTLLDNNQCVPPFIQYDGIDACIKLLKNDDLKPEFALNLLQMLKKVANASDEYKRMLQEKGLPDLVNKIIKKLGPYDKKLEYEGRQLLFVTNLCKVELEDPNKIHVDEIKIVEPIPPEVKNYLTSGKQVKIINNNGARFLLFRSTALPTGHFLTFSSHFYYFLYPLCGIDTVAVVLLIFWACSALPVFDRSDVRSGERDW